MKKKPGKEARTALRTERRAFRASVLFSSKVRGGTGVLSQLFATTFGDSIHLIGGSAGTRLGSEETFFRTTTAPLTFRFSGGPRSGPSAATGC